MGKQLFLSGIPHGLRARARERKATAQKERDEQRRHPSHRAALILSAACRVLHPDLARGIVARPKARKSAAALRLLVVRVRLLVAIAPHLSREA
jgi:hypothetical protein